jgi:hypothetical protein
MIKIDIVNRLRAPVTVERDDGIRIEAADEIERLRNEVASLQGLARELSEILSDYQNSKEQGDELAP